MPPAFGRRHTNDQILNHCATSSSYAINAQWKQTTKTFAKKVQFFMLEKKLDDQIESDRNKKQTHR